MRSPFPIALLTVIASMASLLSSADAFSPPLHRHLDRACHRLSRRWSTTSAPITLAASSKATIEGPPVSTKPDYSSIHGPLGSLVDDVLMSIFRVKFAERLNRPDNDILTPDSKLAPNDFMGLIELTSSMNSQYNNRTQVQELALDVLVSLFPPFILDRFPSWFARPFPEFSSRLCAWATVVGGTWLMGECEVNDIPAMENGSGKRQGVLVKRCRFLEESQCASICVNSCKIPTQNFFRRNMGLDLTMTPDYETGECQFAYGRSPTEEEEREAKETPCLMRCPSGGGMRSWHDGRGNEKKQWLMDLEALAKDTDATVGSTCLLMED